MYVGNTVRVKAKHYLWLLALLAFLGIPLVALHSLHLQTKNQVSAVSRPMSLGLQLKQFYYNK